MTYDLLEREPELAALRGLVAQARAGTGGVALVQAPAGHGKTALLEAIAAETELRVLKATGAALERAFAFGLVRRLVGGNEPEAEQLTLEPNHEHLRAFDALAGPLLIIVDDAHLADAGSLHALRRLAQGIANRPLALVLAASDTARLEIPAGRVLRPQPLSHDAVARLLVEALDRAVAPDFVAAAIDTTGGRPLLVRELCRTLVHDRYAGTAGEAPYVRQAIPSSLAGMVQGRLWRLPPSCLGLARAVAALGERSAARCALALAGVDLAVGSRAHAALVQVGLLERDGLRFTHPLMAEATLAGVLPATRSALHRRAAALLAKAKAPEEEIAAQLLAADRGRDPWAMELLTRTGIRALAAGDTETALALLRRALAESAELNGELLLALGVAESRLGDPTAHVRLEWAARMGARLVIP